MTQQLRFDVDASDTYVVYVPLYGLWDFLRLLPQGLAEISYHYQTQEAQVRFPGLRPPMAQMIVDAALVRERDWS